MIFKECGIVGMLKGYKGEVYGRSSSDRPEKQQIDVVNDRMRRLGCDEKREFCMMNE